MCVGMFLCHFVFEELPSLKQNKESTQHRSRRPRRDCVSTSTYEKISLMSALSDLILFCEDCYSLVKKYW